MKEVDPKLNKSEGLSIPVEVKFFPEKATLLLKVVSNLPDLEVKIKEAAKLGLTPKKEFHLTIIGSDTGEVILKSLESLSKKDKEELLNQIRALAEAIRWKVVLKNEFFYIQKEYHENGLEKRQSIIQLAEITGLEDFYKNLNLLLNQHFAVPLPHVTLFTTSSKEDQRLRGIGIYSKQQFEELKPKEI